MYAAFGLIAVLVILVIVLLFRGCTPAKQEETKPTATKTVVASGSTEASSKKSSKSDGSNADTIGDSNSSSKKSSSKSKESQVTKVKVKVAKGKTAWIEVKVDGKSVYGAQATGPFEQEYTPESSIEITTSKPSDVTVTKNGEKVRYDTKTSGVARVTITVPKKQSSSNDSSKDSASGDSTDSTNSNDSGDGTTGTQSSDGTDGTTGTDSNGDASSSGDSSPRTILRHPRIRRIQPSRNRLDPSWLKIPASMSYQR